MANSLTIWIMPADTISDEISLYLFHFKNIIKHSVMNYYIIIYRHENLMSDDYNEMNKLIAIVPNLQSYNKRIDI